MNDSRLLLSVAASGVRFAGPVGVASFLLGTIIMVATVPTTSDAATALLVGAAAVCYTVTFLTLIVPRRYEVSADAIVIRFVLGRHWRLPFSTIAELRPASGWMAYGYWGVRFATHPGASIELRRQRPRLLGRPNLIISPVQRDDFLRVANAALQASRET